MKRLLISILLIFTLTGCGLLTPPTTTVKDDMTFQLSPGLDTIEMGETWIDPGCTFILGEVTFEPDTVLNQVDTSILGEYIVYYRLTYEDYTYEAERHVMVVDESSPVIALLPGVDTIYIGENWEDGGITVSDNDEDNVSIIITGTVDENTVGTYTITYTATDSAGNASSISRIVTVTDHNPYAMMTVEDVIALEIGDHVHVVGIITAIVYYGFSIYQDGHYIFVFDENYSDQISLGAEVDIKGVRDEYNSGDQISNITLQVLSQHNDIPDPETATILEITNEEVEYGSTITVTGYLEYDEDINLYTLRDTNNNVINIYYRSQIQELESFIENTITIDVILLHYATVSYYETAEDVIVVE